MSPEIFLSYSDDLETVPAFTDWLIWKVSLWLPKGLTWIAVDRLNFIPIFLRYLDGFVIPCSYWRQPFDKRLYSSKQIKDENQQEKQLGKWLHPTVKSVDLQNCSRSVE